MPHPETLGKSVGDLLIFPWLSPWFDISGSALHLCAFPSRPGGCTAGQILEKKIWLPGLLLEIGNNLGHPYFDQAPKREIQTQNNPGLLGACIFVSVALAGIECCGDMSVQKCQEIQIAFLTRTLNGNFNGKLNPFELRVVRQFSAKLTLFQSISPLYYHDNPNNYSLA